MAKSKSAHVALMSIHPEYADAIMRGDKRVEFRRTIPQREVSHVVVYATRPIAAVVGVFEVQRVERRLIKELWSEFGAVGCINKESFFKYFSGKEFGYAIVTGAVTLAKVPFALASMKELPARPPQSFVYLKPTVLRQFDCVA